MKDCPCALTSVGSSGRHKNMVNCQTGSSSRRKYTVVKPDHQVTARTRWSNWIVRSPQEHGQTGSSGRHVRGTWLVIKLDEWNRQENEVKIHLSDSAETSQTWCKSQWNTKLLIFLTCQSVSVRVSTCTADVRRSLRILHSRQLCEFLYF